MGTKENTPSYKGYIGSVSFSEKDSAFFGKIEVPQSFAPFTPDKQMICPRQTEQMTKANGRYVRGKQTVL